MEKQRGVPYFDSLYEDEDDYTGMSFGNWTVLGPSTKYEGGSENKDDRRYWWCKCSCGEVAQVCLYSLLKGRSTKCKKCKYKSMHEGNKKPVSLCKHPLYGTWDAMMAKCYNEDNMYYSKNGAVGVTVCEEWHNLEAFIRYVESLGDHPDGCRLHRVDTSKGFFPGNIEWRSHDCTPLWVAEYKSEMESIFRRAKSLHRHLPRTETWKVIRPKDSATISTYGNCSIPFYEHGGRPYITIEGVSLLLYRVVYATFTDRSTNELSSILHLNDNPWDNRIWNLVEGTPQENMHMRSYNRERTLAHGGEHLWWLSRNERNFLLPVNL